MKGEEVISCKYDYVGSWVDCGLRECKRNGKYGYLNMKGEEVISCKYDYVGSWVEGVAAVKMDGLYGLINTEGQVVIPFKYQEIGEECYGLRKCKRNNKYGYLNSKGEEFVACKYDDATSFFKSYDNNVIARVWISDECICIDDKGNTMNKEEYNKVYNVVEQPPTFPGGETALLKYIATHVKYPQIAQEQDIQGVVNLRFVVEEDGSVHYVQVAKSLESHCDAEAVRVVKSLPRFIPGKQQGKAVMVWFSLPVRFQLQ